MKKILIFLPLALIACTDYHNSKLGMSFDERVNTNVSAQIAADNTKISGSAECWEFLFFLHADPEKQTYIPEMMNKAGNLANNACTAGAVYDAVSKNNSDLLISPQYTTVKNGLLCTPIGCLFGHTKAIVSGYSAKITAIK